MKKGIIILIAALLTVWLAACGEDSSNSSDATTATQMQAAMTVTLEPDVIEGFDLTGEDLDAVKRVLEDRLKNITQSDFVVTTDNTTNFIVIRLSEAISEEDIDSLLYFWSTLTFRDSDGNTLMDNTDVKKASVAVNAEDKDIYLIQLDFTDEGSKEFAKVTKEHLNEAISIYLDDMLLSAPVVKAVITGGSAQITGDFTAEEATELANKINASLLPFSSLRIVSVN